MFIQGMTVYFLIITINKTFIKRNINNFYFFIVETISLNHTQTVTGMCAAVESGRSVNAFYILLCRTNVKRALVVNIAARFTVCTGSTRARVF